MGRYVGLSHNRGKGGGGGSGTIITTSAYDRSSGISTNAQNNVTSVTLGANKYEGIMYNNVGLITGYNEHIGDDIKGWSLAYDSNNLCTAITQVSQYPTFSLSPSTTTVNEGSSVTFTLTTERIVDGTTIYWDVSGTGIDAADFSSADGSVTVTNNTATFSVTLTNDVATEGDEVFTANVYPTSARTNNVASSANVTISDTSTAPTTGGTIFHSDAWNTNSTYNWTVPTGVTAISVVCVGGGGAGETNHDAAGAGGGGLA